MFFTIVNRLKKWRQSNEITNHDSKLTRIYVAVLFSKQNNKIVVGMLNNYSICFVIIMGVLSVFRARKYFFPATKIHFRN